MLENNQKEAQRCLACANPFCEKGCPINTPIKEVIELYNNNQKLEAGKILFENNPFSAFCGLLCPHERNCEGSCVLGIKGDPVAFGNIEHEISAQYLKKVNFDLPKDNGYSVAIVGGGPAGITSAIILAQAGFRVDLYDEAEQLGGILSYGIPEFRFDHDLLKEYNRILEQLGVTIYKKTFGKDCTLEHLVQNYDYINLAFGLAHSTMIDVPGNDLEHVVLGTDFLKTPCHKDYDQVVVIGTGNVAMDVARSAKRCGASKVTVLRRRGSENMSSTKKEVEAAIADGVEFQFYSAPYEFKGQEAIFQKTQEQDGQLIFLDEFLTLDADLIVLATGQVADQELLTQLALELTPDGLIKTNDYNQTSKENVFVSGDLHLGAKTIVEAVADAKKTSNYIINQVKN